MTDYGYETADGKAKSRVTTLQNRVTYGTAMTAENTVTNYNSAYEYDANGNITAEYAVNADGTRTLRYRYTYDEANQLTRVDDNVRGKTYVYTYDKGGNRVSEKIYNYTLSASLGTAQQTIESTYGYLTTWKDRLSSYNGKTITYDAAGNPIKYGNTTYVWSGKQLIEIQPGDGTKTQFSYDADGLRTQKRQYNTDGKLDYYVDYVWQNGKLTQQVMTLMGYNADGSTVKIRPINTKFVYDGNSDQPTACFVGETQMLFVRNLQGDIVAVVSNEGEVLVNFTYDAWGNVEYTVPEGQEEGLATLIPLFCPLTYRGYNYDFTTGLYYLQSRYYNPQWGRFMNVDDTSILLATQGETHNANLFAYCSNNPVNRVDYTGYSADFALTIALQLVILLYLSDYYTSDYFEVSQYAGAGAIKIKINKGDFIERIYDCVCINEDVTYSVLAVVTNYIFREKIGDCFAKRGKQRSILFSDECLKEEIKLHANGYMAALNKDNIDMPTLFSIYAFRVHPFSSKKRKDFIKGACMEIDIKEYSVADPVESVGFSYYSGIRDCYINTNADPFYSRKLKRRVKVFPTYNGDWEEYLFDYTD